MPPALLEREWRIQCKRERRLGPRQVEAIAEDLVRGDTPYGAMLCAACDFSRAAREKFRGVLLAAGVDQAFLWGKAELEDRLFQPANDHLMWAYFGVSLQVRRRSMKSELRTRLAAKRHIARVLGEPTGDRKHEVVFIRDVEGLGYPDAPEGADERASWDYHSFEGHVGPDLLGFVTRKHFAIWDRESGEYDMFEPVDLSYPDLYELGIVENTVDAEESNARNYWQARVPRAWQAIAKELSVIHYDQVLAIDEFGDVVNPGPHLIVDCEGRDTPFRRSRLFLVEGEYGAGEHVSTDELTRKQLFPKKLPEVTWREVQASFEKK